MAFLSLASGRARTVASLTVGMRRSPGTLKEAVVVRGASKVGDNARMDDGFTNSGLHHDDSCARLNASLDSRVERGHDDRGGTKLSSTGTLCKARRPAGEKLASSQLPHSVVGPVHFLVFLFTRVWARHSCRARNW